MPSYNFGHFDDDVSKEGNDLTVDTTFSTTDNTTLATNTQSVLSNQELADISQVKHIKEYIIIKCLEVDYAIQIYPSSPLCSVGIIASLVPSFNDRTC